MNFDSLAAEWIRLKISEHAITERRRAIEDEMRKMAKLDDNFTGTETIDTDAYAIKITGRLDRKVDASQLHEIAKQNEMAEHLPTLFRWKAELNMAEWRKANGFVIAAFSQAITSKPGRASIEIVQKSEKSG